uniref:Uncharacterized protein n=1 Tax=Anopheles atroparvus TaxID=41427 RepID=A0AAG5CNL7_ANOAO
MLANKLARAPSQLEKQTFYDARIGLRKMNGANLAGINKPHRWKVCSISCFWLIRTKAPNLARKMNLKFLFALLFALMAIAMGQAVSDESADSAPSVESVESAESGADSNES